MIAYILSFAVGLGVGVAYGLLNVRSPAPPIVALVGLLGILIGEAVVSSMRSKAAPPITIERAETSGEILSDGQGGKSK